MSNSTPGLVSARRHASFVVRVWAEPGIQPPSLGEPAEPDGAADLRGGADQGRGLRGSVEHVGSRALRHFASLEAMLEIIAEVVERSASLAPTSADPDGSGR